MPQDPFVSESWGPPKTLVLRNFRVGGPWQLTMGIFRDHGIAGWEGFCFVGIKGGRAHSGERKQGTCRRKQGRSGRRGSEQDKPQPCAQKAERMSHRQTHGQVGCGVKCEGTHTPACAMDVSPSATAPRVSDQACEPQGCLESWQYGDESRQSPGPGPSCASSKMWSNGDPPPHLPGN